MTHTVKEMTESSTVQSHFNSHVDDLEKGMMVSLVISSPVNIPILAEAARPTHPSVAMLNVIDDMKPAVPIENIESIPVDDQPITDAPAAKRLVSNQIDGGESTQIPVAINTNYNRGCNYKKRRQNKEREEQRKVEQLLAKMDAYIASPNDDEMAVEPVIINKPIAAEAPVESSSLSQHFGEVTQHEQHPPVIIPQSDNDVTDEMHEEKQLMTTEPMSIDSEKKFRRKKRRRSSKKLAVVEPSAVAENQQGAALIQKIGSSVPPQFEHQPTSSVAAQQIAIDELPRLTNETLIASDAAEILDPLNNDTLGSTILAQLGIETVASAAEIALPVTVNHQPGSGSPILPRFEQPTVSSAQEPKVASASTANKLLVPTVASISKRRAKFIAASVVNHGRPPWNSSTKIDYSWLGRLE